MATNGREEESTAAAADAAIWRQRLLKCWNFVLVNKFLFLSLLGVAGGENPTRLNSYIWWANGAIAGVILGLILKTYTHLTSVTRHYVGFPGEILMRMLQVVTVPLIVTSVVVGVSGLTVRASRRIAIRAVICIMSSSLIAVITDVQLVGQYVEGTNMTGLIIWAFIFGLAINRIGETGDALVELLTVINEATKKIFNMILGYLPIGVLFMITSHVVEVEDWETALSLGKFMGVVIFGSAALPLMFLCCEEKLRINRKVTRFMLPICTSTNMNGSVLYEVVAVVFIAQLNPINLNLSHVTAAATSISAGGIPAAGAVTTLFVLTAVGLPAQDASILVAAEWLLDRCNTVINVFSDCTGVSIIYEVSKKELEEHRLEMIQMDFSNAADVAPDQIQVHLSDRDSEKSGKSILQVQ